MVGSVDLRHLLDGEVENGDDVFDGGDFIEGQGSAFAGFQVFFDDLIATDVEIPNRLRDRRKELGGIDVAIIYLT